MVPLHYRWGASADSRTYFSQALYISWATHVYREDCSIATSFLAVFELYVHCDRSVPYFSLSPGLKGEGCLIPCVVMSCCVLCANLRTYIEKNMTPNQVPMREFTIGINSWNMLESERANTCNHGECRQLIAEDAHPSTTPPSFICCLTVARSRIHVVSKEGGGLLHVFEFQTYLEMIIIWSHSFFPPKVIIPNSNQPYQVWNEHDTIWSIWNWLLFGMGLLSSVLKIIDTTFEKTNAGFWGCRTRILVRLHVSYDPINHKQQQKSTCEHNSLLNKSIYWCFKSS